MGFKNIALLVALAAATPAFAAPVTFIFNYTDAAGAGFNDVALGAQRKAALELAGTYWSNLLVASYAGQTIRIDADMNVNATSLTPLASSGTNNSYSFTGVGTSLPFRTDTLYAATLAEQLAHTNMNGAGSDAKLTFSSTAAMTTDTYLGLDRNPGATQFDFVTFSERAIARTLGINSRIDRGLVTTDGSQLGEFQTPSGTAATSLHLPTSHDRLLAEKQGDGSFLALTDMTTAQRIAALSGSSLYWTGAYAAAANGGEFVKLNSMPLNADGTINGNVSVYMDVSELSLMSYGYPGKGVAMDADALTIGQLQDLGWNIAAVPEPGTYAMLLAGLGLIGMMVRRRA